MSICLKIHPDDYDKAANEKFYEQMAEKGWLVTKRWANLSKFVRTEPQQLKFDIYYSDNNHVSGEEKAVFNTDGRKIVEVKSYVHVSYAPKNLSLSPILNIDENAAKALIPLKNKISMLQSPLVLIFMLVFLKSIRTELTYNAFVSLPFFVQRIFDIITMPEIYIAMLIPLVYIGIVATYERTKWKKAVAAFHNGKNPDDVSKKKILYISGIFISILSLIFCAFSVFCNMWQTEYEIPEISDGLYLDIHDFGISDKITKKGLVSGDDYISNKITHRNTLSSQMILTQEYYDINGKSVIIYQDIIQYKSQKTALYAAKLLSSDDGKVFSEYEKNGFEKVYTESENIICVINNRVYRITYITSDDSLVPSTEQILDAILQKR